MYVCVCIHLNAFTISSMCKKCIELTIQVVLKKKKSRHVTKAPCRLSNLRNGHGVCP